MSRSYKHTPIGGITTCRSEKKDKQRANRLFRRTNKIHTLNEKEPLVMNELVNLWDMGKDGKRYFGKYWEEKWYKKFMRK